MMRRLYALAKHEPLVCNWLETTELRGYRLAVASRV